MLLTLSIWTLSPCLLTRPVHVLVLMDEVGPAAAAMHPLQPYPPRRPQLLPGTEASSRSFGEMRTFGTSGSPGNCSVDGICKPKRVKGAESLLGGIGVADFLLLRQVWLVRDTDLGHSGPVGSASLPGPRASCRCAQCSTQPLAAEEYLGSHLTPADRRRPPAGECNFSC